MMHFSCRLFPVFRHAARNLTLVLGVFCLAGLFLAGTAEAAKGPKSQSAGDPEAKKLEDGKPDDSAVLPRWWRVFQYVNDEGEPVSAKVEGTGYFSLTFEPDEALCKKRYREQWDSLCGRRTGLRGRPVAGATMDPPLAGEWRWNTDMGFNFRPDKGWPADTAYKAVIPSSALPQGVTIEGNLSFRSQPVMPNVQGDFKFDPQNTAKMGISGSINFNYPMDKESVLSRLSITATADNGEKALLGKPEFTWTGSNWLYFSVPVLELPANPTSVNVSVAAGSMAASGGKPGDRSEMNIALPGKGDLFKLTQVLGTVMTNADLRAKQLLTLQFSMPTTPAEVLPAIKVLLLPRQRVNGTNDAKEPYSWWSHTEITPAVLEASRPLKLNLPEGANTASMLVGFPFDEEVEGGRFLLVSIPSGIKSAAGMAMRNEGVFLVRVPTLSAALEIMQHGSVLALTGDKTLSLYSRKLDAVSYEAAQVRPEFINHLVTRWGGFADPSMYGVDIYNISTITNGNIPLVMRDGESPQFSTLNLGPMLKDGQKGLFLLKLSGMRDGETRTSDSRFVLVTDLGLIRKQARDGSSLVYAASLATGKPAANVTIHVLGANGLSVFEGKTDSEGRVAVPSLNGLKNEKKAVAVTATLGDDLAFLPLDDYRREIEYSAFQVGGNSSLYRGLNAFLFGERDMYRPGETVHFGYMVKQGSWKAAELKGLPLHVRISDPRGNQVSTSSITLSDDGFGELSWPLAETALTGVYRVELGLNSPDNFNIILQWAEFRVEEFQADTLNLTVKLEPAATKGWLRPQDLEAKGGLKADISLMNMFGAPASGHKLIETIDSHPMFFSFSEYPDWHFYDASPWIPRSAEVLPNAVTDDEGHVTLPLSAAFYNAASMRLELSVQGFDASGGRAVFAKASALLSPLDMVVGWRTGSNLDYLRQNGEASLELMAVSSDLTPLDKVALTLETVAVTYVKSLGRDDDGRYRYDKLRQEKVTTSRPITLSAKGLSVPLDLSTPGEWVLVARNAKGDVVARIPYIVAGDAPAQFGEDRNPILIARLDKKDYNPGDEVEVFLSTPYKGAGLITVERDSVVAQTWFTGDTGSLVRRIRLPEDFEGRAYLNVTYFRALDDKDIFTRPLATTVVPFTINMENRDLNITVKPVAADGSALVPQQGSAVVRPGTLRVAVTADEPARAVVFAVDEGILQLTSFATPDPLKALLGDRALEVVTTQYFDLLMPEYSLMKATLSAFGGGEGLNFSAMGQNPFRRPGEKSAVFWSGLINLGPKGTVVDIPTPPSFSGRMRVMVVGCSPTEVGSARTDVKVQAEVVIQPSLPLFVTPGDEFEAVATLTDMSGLPLAEGKTGRPVRLEVKTDAGLELVGPAPETVELVPGREQTVKLRFRALDVPGGSTVTFVVSPLEGAPGGIVERPMGLSVRPATPRSTQVLMGRMGKSPYTADIDFTRKLYPQFASMSASVSALPLPVAHGLFHYLAKYPYGCTEQVVSAAFPSLVMLARPELAPRDETPDMLRQRVVTALDVLSSRYNGDGDFALWPDGYAGDFFLAVYAADFLTTAEETGVAVPFELKQNLLASLQARASATPTTFSDARVSAYAAWVLTRNGVLTSNILATQTAWLDNYQPKWKSDITAVFMAGCWKLMMENKEAERLLAGYRPESADSHVSFDDLGYLFSPLLSRSFYLSVLGGQFPDRLRAPATSVILDQILDLAAQDYVTTSAAQASRALMIYSQGMASAVSDASITALDASGQPLALAPLQGKNVRETSFNSDNSDNANSSNPDGDGDFFPRLASLKFQASGPTFWQVESTGFDRAPASAPLSDGMTVSREFRMPDGKPATVFHQGDELIVVLRARSFGNPLSNAAIVDMLPGCFEMVMAQGGSAVSIGTEQGSLPTDRPMDVVYVERREDRLLLFPSLETTDTVYRYRVRVTSRGSFTLPPLTAEAMYEPAVRAHTAASEIVVE